MLKKIYKNSVILITGGTGSWGQQLTQQLLEHKPKEIRIYSRGEFAQVMMKRKFQDPNIHYFIGDVRDLDRLSSVCDGVDYIFHLAALKHVPVCEENPWEAVKTNVAGTQNIIDCALKNKVKKVIYVSSDKAVDPINMYGVTKAAAEKLIIAANLLSGHTAFVCVRAGNVLGSQGSVIPLFKEQILRLNTITLTDERMSRFIIDMQSVINLVLRAGERALGGEMFVTKIPSCRVVDVAHVMIKKLAKKSVTIKNVGIRPGEKLYETLVSSHEAVRTYEENDYFIIYPHSYILDTEVKKNSRRLVLTEFNSNNSKILSKQNLEDILTNQGWFMDDKKSDGYLSRIPKKDLFNFFQSEGWTK